MTTYCSFETYHWSMKIIFGIVLSLIFDVLLTSIRSDNRNTIALKEYLLLFKTIPHPRLYCNFVHLLFVIAIITFVRPFYLTPFCIRLLHRILREAHQSFIGAIKIKTLKFIVCLLSFLFLLWVRHAVLYSKYKKYVIVPEAVVILSQLIIFNIVKLWCPIPYKEKHANLNLFRTSFD